MESITQRYINERAAAAYLGLSVQLLRKFRLQKLPPVWLKFGRSVRYDLQTLDAFAASRQVAVDPARTNPPAVDR